MKLTTEEKSIVACFIGFILMAFYSIWYLKETAISGRYLKSALRKYETEVLALVD